MKEMIYSGSMRAAAVLFMVLILASFVSCERETEPAPPPPPQPEETGPADFSLTREDKLELLRMARACVEAAVRGERPPRFETDSENLRQIGAAFVTLKTRGRLRGCIGTILANEPLYRCVQRRAVDAAVNDLRFVSNRLQPSELEDVTIEISVLTPPKPVSDPDEIVVGRDGVLLTFGRRRGVFLPQVPIEQGWDLGQYLSRLCGKARVSDPDCWQSPQAKLESFQAIVFSEHELGVRR